MGTIDFTTMIYTYMLCSENKLPFTWKCIKCGTKTDIIEFGTSEYECSNPKCVVKLKFSGNI